MRAFESMGSMCCAVCESRSVQGVAVGVVVPHGVCCEVGACVCVCGSLALLMLVLLLCAIPPLCFS